MPDTRVSLTHKFEIAGHEGYITVGLYESGQPGELFIQMAKEGSTIGGLMDTVATLTSLALQYGVPLESLVKKFAYQRFEPSGFTKNPDIRNATSITDYIFRWLGCQFIKGYKEATSPSRSQLDLPMKEIADIDKKAINRPVAELPRTAEREIIDVITNRSNSEGTARSVSEWKRLIEDACRPGSRGVGKYVYRDELLALRQHESDSCRSVRRLHRVRHVAGVQLARRYHELNRATSTGYGRCLGGEGAGDNPWGFSGAFNLCILKLTSGEFN